MTQVLTIDGMSCGHCALKVKNALEALAGVESAEASLSDNEVTVTLTSSVDERDYAAAVEQAGYTFVSSR